MFDKNIIAKNMKRLIAEQFGTAKGSIIEAGRACGYMSDTDYRNFHNYYSAKREPSMNDLIKIAYGLNAGVEELTGGSASLPKVQGKPKHSIAHLGKLEGELAVEIAYIVDELEIDATKDEILAWAKEFYETFVKDKNKKPPRQAVEIFIETKRSA